MRSTTAKIATALDVNVVVASCLFGVISGSFGLRQLQEVNRRLKEVWDGLYNFRFFACKLFYKYFMCIAGTFFVIFFLIYRMFMSFLLALFDRYDHFISKEWTDARNLCNLIRSFRTNFRGRQPGTFHITKI